MKPIALILALLVLLFTESSPSMAEQSAPKGVDILASKIPTANIRITDPKGQPSGLSAFEGRTIVLNVWATWCGPCIKELPSLERLSDKLDPSKAMVLLVSQDKGGVAVAKPFLDRLGIKNLETYGDPSSKLSRDLAIRGLPTTFVISPNGQIVGRVEGPLEWDAPDMVEFIRHQ